LVYKGVDAKFYGAIAKSWSIDPSWENMKFVLDERARFGNGQPVTAHDVKFSIERAMKKEMKFVFGGELRRQIDRVETAGDHSLIVHLKKPYPAFLDRASKVIGIQPKKYVEKVGNEGMANHPIGAGPFEFVSYKQDVIFKVKAKKDHYRKVPDVQELDLHYIQENATRIAMLKAGEADVVMIQPEHIDIVKSSGNARVVLSKFGKMTTLCFHELYFKEKPSPWHDIRVRKAVAYAINTKVIAENIFRGAGQAWGNIVAPYHTGYNPNLKPHPFDPEKAKELLAEAGYANGFDTTFTSPVTYKLDAQAVEASLKKVGIRAKLNILEHGIWSSKLGGKDVRDIGLLRTPWWAGRTHPATALTSALDKASKWTYVNTPEIQTAFEKLATLIDENEIAAQVGVLTKLYHEQMPRMNLWALHTPYGVSERVKYWENIPGRVYLCNFEFLELK
jgi:peptide/nickel transport system substrate-binding protein